MHCSRRLIVQTLVFSLSYLHRQVSPPETLVVKGGTTWARNGRWILPENARLQGSFTCGISMTWDKRLYFPSEGRRAEDFFRREKSDRFCRVWTRNWAPNASTLPLDHRVKYVYLKVGIPMFFCEYTFWVFIHVDSKQATRVGKTAEVSTPRQWIDRTWFRISATHFKGNIRKASNQC